ncbi:MAG: hypothetical protein ACTHMS_10285 [Jatrophihabitans sp.]|uniref:hypothetical protein n=1 Tax=Jatrophihabitans sp. TaxID=1932789 RepID=UPI003F7FF0E2
MRLVEVHLAAVGHVTDRRVILERLAEVLAAGGVGEDLNRAPLLLAVGSRLMSSPNSVAR